jgi:hypothetical protein
MQYTIYTTVDVTNTGQYRSEPGKEVERWKEQNYQTLIQILGIRANIVVLEKPVLMQINGSILGFNTTDIINVWRFIFETERDYPFGTDENPLEFLENDFDGVPFISGLDESMEQNFDVFVVDGPSRNIIFVKNNK